MYDVIVVGARCAGASAAMLLARHGLRVLLLDRARFPSDTLSSHYLHQAGVAQLAKWGLIDRVAATGCPPVSTFIFDVGPFALHGSPPPVEGTAEGYAPRRIVLDQLLVEAAIAAGAEFRDATSVSGLIESEDRVVGVRTRSAAGESTERARLVIGADGRRSMLAQLVGAEVLDDRPTRTCNYYAYWSGLPASGIELYNREGLFFVVAPTHEGLTLVGMACPAEEFPSLRGDVAGAFARNLRTVPRLSDRITSAHRETGFAGTADLGQHIRRASGLGWVLIGDAATYLDPITAQGMSNAFRDADAVAEAVAASSGPDTLDLHVSKAMERRIEEVRPMYEMTYGIAGLAPPDQQTLSLFEALRHNSEATNRFLGLSAGSVAVDEFFAPANLQQILGKRPA